MNPYDKYKQQVVSSMTQGEMLLKLYDETILQLGVARVAIREGKIPEMDGAIQKSKRIIQYLRTCLDMRYPVSNNLSSLYSFFDMELTMASVKKDVKPLDDIEPLIQDLRDTFNQCAKQDRMERSGPSAGTTSANMV